MTDTHAGTREGWKERGPSLCGSTWSEEASLPFLLARITPCFPRLPSLRDMPASLCWDGAQGQESKICPNSWSREEATEAGGDSAAAQRPRGMPLCREPKEEEQRGKGFPRQLQVKGMGRRAIPGPSLQPAVLSPGWHCCFVCWEVETESRVCRTHTHVCMHAHTPWHTHCIQDHRVQDLCCCSRLPRATKTPGKPQPHATEQELLAFNAP